MNKYVHGYSKEEAIRLNDQANSLVELIHYDSVWPEGSIILEAGCGTGAQTKTIATKNNKSQFVSIDISEESLIQAKDLANSQGINNVEFKKANIFKLPFGDESFDHIFICFVLEHLANPLDALDSLKRVLKRNGTIMVIEGDHGSAYFHPDSPLAARAIQCLVQLQKEKGGDANIGRKLYPLLEKAGFNNINVSPRQVYVDDSKQKLVEGFTKNTFTAMIQGIVEEAISKKMMSPEDMEAGVNDLFKSAEGGGTFCYTFFKGVAIKN